MPFRTDYIFWRSSRKLFLFLLLFAFKCSSGQLQIDGSYALNGRLRLTFDDFNEAVSILNCGDDSIRLLCNSSHADSLSYDNDIVIAGLLPNGNFDLQFGLNGITRFDFNAAAISIAKSFVQKSDGGFFVFGNGFDTAAPQFNPMCIAAVEKGGKVDSSFGINGTRKISLSGGTENPGKIKVDSLGRIWICGSTTDTADTHSESPVLMRLKQDGTNDTTFGKQGKVLLKFNNGVAFSRDDRHLIGGTFNDFIFLNDGRILCAGGYSNGNNLAAFFATFFADGKADTSFYDGGVLSLDFTPFASSYVLKMEERNGAIFFAVKSDLAAERDFYYGFLDLQNETVVTDALPFSTNEDLAKDLAETGGGARFLCGYSKLQQHSGTSYSSDYFAVGEITGHQYPYGSNTQLFAFDTNAQNGATCMAPLSNNKLLCAGFVNRSDGIDIALLKLNYFPAGLHDENCDAFRVYPNPFDRGLFFEGNAGRDFQLLDVCGRVLLETEINTGAGAIQLPDLAHGIYYARVGNFLNRLVH